MFFKKWSNGLESSDSSELKMKNFKEKELLDYLTRLILKHYWLTECIKLKLMA